MKPDVEVGERYLLWKQELLIWGGEARARPGQNIHTSGPSACCDVTKAGTAPDLRGKEPEEGGTPKKLPRSSQASKGSRR